MNALITVRTGGFFRHSKKIADLAIKNRLPSMHEGSDFVDGGGLASYASSYGEAYRRAAVYVDKILKGAKPADLPIEQPTKFELVVNLKTAKHIGLTIPQMCWRERIGSFDETILDFRFWILDWGEPA